MFQAKAREAARLRLVTRPLQMSVPPADLKTPTPRLGALPSNQRPSGLAGWTEQSQGLSCLAGVGGHGHGRNGCCDSVTLGKLKGFVALATGDQGQSRAEAAAGLMMENRAHVRPGSRDGQLVEVTFCRHLGSQEQAGASTALSGGSSSQQAPARSQPSQPGDNLQHSQAAIRVGKLCVPSPRTRRGSPQPLWLLQGLGCATWRARGADFHR